MQQCYSKFSSSFDEVFHSEDTEVILTPVRAPNANAVAERWIRTVRTECMDWVLVLGRQHLDRVLRTYTEHFNERRPHRALDLAAPVEPVVDAGPVSPREVRRRDLLGGLIHEYYGAAA
jgi:transposase InsO family protein